MQDTDAVSPKARTHRPPIKVLKDNLFNDPLHLLAVGILRQAVEDALSEDEENAKDAIEFLSSDSEDLRFWCAKAGVSSKSVAHIESILEDNSLKGALVKVIELYLKG